MLRRTVRLVPFSSPYAFAVRTIHVAESVEDMIQYQRRHRDQIGFVPTMGALHEGHLSLVDQAKSRNETVVASIFVNPTQFSAGEDLDRYPRQLEKDIEMLKQRGVDCVFAPKSTAQMYAKDALCHVEPARFSNIMEGIARPDFFRGVATVVCKLFNIVQPASAYFGQKDISQCILIQKMVRDLNMPVQVIICPTVREADGLAMSSRNAYLTASERPVADVLYRALMAGKEYCDQLTADGVEVDTAAVERAVQSVLATEPMVSHVEYVSIASHTDMTELKTLIAFEHKSAGAVISSAIRLGNVRLIDNVLVGRAIDDILSVKR